MIRMFFAAFTWTIIGLGGLFAVLVAMGWLLSETPPREPNLGGAISEGIAE